MSRYQKNPVEITAFQLTKENAKELTAWCGGRLVEEIDAIHSSERYVGINISTPEGIMRASEGDWLIRGVKGEFYPCKPEIFDLTYTKVED